jgi:hypothetical protein
LTVQFPPALTLREVLLTAPTAAECSAPTLEPARRLSWGRIVAAGLLALVPLGAAASVALALATEVAGQTRGRR